MSTANSTKWTAHVGGQAGLVAGRLQAPNQTSPSRPWPDSVDRWTAQSVARSTSHLIHRPRGEARACISVAPGPFRYFVRAQARRVNALECSAPDEPLPALSLQYRLDASPTLTGNPIRRRSIDDRRHLGPDTLQQVRQVPRRVATMEANRGVSQRGRGVHQLSRSCTRAALLHQHRTFLPARRHRYVVIEVQVQPGGGTDINQGQRRIRASRVRWSSLSGSSFQNPNRSRLVPDDFSPCLV